MKKQNNGGIIFGAIFFISIISIFIVAFVMDGDEAAFSALIFLFVIVFVIAVCASIIKTKGKGKTKSGITLHNNTNSTNSVFNKKLKGRLLRLWDERREKKTKYGEETYYTYHVEYEYVTDLGQKITQKQEIPLNIYSEVMHLHNDQIPLVSNGFRVSVDLEELNPMNRFKPHD